MIDVALLLSFIEVESNFNPRAFLNDRNGGSYGLGQIDLATAEWAGYNMAAIDLYQPRNNIPTMVKILAKLAADLQAHGKWSLENLAAAYNSGLAHVLQGGTDAAYSAKITSAYSWWRAALACDMPAIEP